MAVLEIANMSKSFGSNKVLDSIDLSIEKGEIRALLGENGSGKSTLIKILSGYHTPDSGSVVRVNGEVLSFGSAKSSLALGLRFVHQNLGLVDTSSVLDNLLIAEGFPTTFGTIRNRQVRRQAREMLKRVSLEVDVDQPVGELSLAAKTGVALARLLRKSDSGEAAVLILDEPTATLQVHEVDQLLEIIRTIAASGVAVLYVTHRLEEVFQIANSVTILRDGREVLTAPIGELNRHDLIHHMLGKELEESESRISLAQSLLEGGVVMEVEGLISSRLSGASLSVKAGEILGLAGLTGSGREEFCGVVFGANERDAGEVTIRGARILARRPDLSIEEGVCYISADRARDGAFMELVARENLAITQIRSYWRWPSLRRKPEQEESSKWYGHLQVRPHNAHEERFGNFSGGNQQKLLFGRWLQRSPKLFLLDEPTQGVDVGTKAFIHEQLLEAALNGAAVIVSSSDHEELATLCHRVAIFQHGRVASYLVGEEVTALNITSECQSAGQREEVQ